MSEIWLLMSGISASFFKDTIEALEVTPWMQIWQMKLPSIIVFSVFLLLLVVLMIFKDTLAKRRTTLKAVSYVMLLFSFIYVGLMLKAQPTTTNIVILANGIINGAFPLGLYIMEPYIFLSFLFIIATIILWGRGVFCGWLCPYGAMLELLNKLQARFFPKLRITLSAKVHWKLIYLKYVVFAIILGVSFYSFMLSEYIAEVEPFKSFVLKLKRQWHFVSYFMILTAGSVVIYRAYCRYLCPLGAALSIPSFLKFIPLVKMKRHDLCGKCRICGNECNYQAIASDGRIRESECLDCLDCQVNFWDEGKCPALIKKRGRGQEAGGKSEEDNNLKFKIQNSRFKTLISRVVIRMSFPLVGNPSEERLRTSRSDRHHTYQLIIICALLLFPSIIHAKTFNVGADYPTINEALKKADNGDVIEVNAGEYRERLKIEKAVHLRGINDPVILVNKGLIIEIASQGVTVEGFTIKDESTTSDLSSSGVYISKGSHGAAVRNNHFYNVMHGIWSVGANGITLEKNTVEGKKALDRNYRGNGIYLTDSQEATIAGNSMNYCRDGMYLEVSHGGRIIGNDTSNSRYAIHTMWVDRSVFSKNTALHNLVGFAVMYSKGSTISDNISVGNQTHGLLLIQTVRSEITGNTVIGNTKGIFLYNSVLNRVASNLLMNNSLGLHNWGGSEENTVTGNSFINNEAQVKFIAGRNQQWDGNYWSDYLGWDMEGDGSGDMPYESNTVVDHILWRYPSSKLLYASASFQLLWMMEKQFPLLKVPRVMDDKPSMLPLQKNWKELQKKYPYKSENFYGEMEKFQVLH
ncbi:MAG: nitrous oxide reductase family maturation protein NosD [Nitrospirae bacterium]|nr:nitrous oxide reductase family maturation protein NosD [Nitrospirota bacterium]